LQWLPRQRLQQSLPVELEALKLELPFLREQLALRREPACVMRRRLLPETLLALKLLLFELLIFEPLLELQGVESARISRCKIGSVASKGLLQLEVERVLLLLELETPMLGNGIGRTRGSAVECRHRDDGVEQWAKTDHKTRSHVFASCPPFVVSPAGAR
jgi:hypothetical protein